MCIYSAPRNAFTLLFTGRQVGLHVCAAYCASCGIVERNKRERTEPESFTFQLFASVIMAASEVVARF